MKNCIVSVKIKLNNCEVGIAKIFVTESEKELASSVALSFFREKYECEVIGIGEFNPS